MLFSCLKGNKFAEVEINIFLSLCDYFLKLKINSFLIVKAKHVHLIQIGK